VFARYAYKYTSPDDTTVRAPIASFWATRSHTLRAEAEDEFKALCLQFPQFGYDVLSELRLLMTMVVPLLTKLYSTRVGRQAQEGAHRQAAPCDWKRSQESKTQRCWKGVERSSINTVSVICRASWALAAFATEGSFEGQRKRKTVYQCIVLYDGGAIYSENDYDVMLSKQRMVF
jgi:hypothetical protein